MRRILPPLLLFFASFAAAQNVTIKKVELAGEKVIVTYDLEDPNSTNEYLLNLYASKDNYMNPLKNVAGDIGMEVKPGTGKHVELNLIQEFGPYKGRIAFEIRGKVYVPFVKLKNFDSEMKYKRGKQYEILWKPGAVNPVSVELFKGGQRVMGEMSHPNNGTYIMSLPSNAKPGKDYRLRITDTKNGDEVVYTPFFRVGPKVPLLVKVLPVLAVGGAAAAFAGGGSSGGGGGGNNNGGGGDIPVPALPK